MTPSSSDKLRKLADELDEAGAFYNGPDYVDDLRRIADELERLRAACVDAFEYINCEDWPSDEVLQPLRNKLKSALGESK